MRILRTVVLSIGLAAFATACGGSDKKEAKEPMEAPAGTEMEEKADDAMDAAEGEMEEKKDDMEEAAEDAMDGDAKNPCDGGDGGW